MALEKIVLIRHAQSMEDVDASLHNLVEDSRMGLTELGVAQAQELRGYLGVAS